MSSLTPQKRAALQDLAQEIAKLEQEVSAKIAKGRSLRALFATKYDSAMVNRLRKKLTIPLSG